MSEKVYARITEQIIEKLEQGTVPWRKPWKSGPEGLPMNLVSRKRYRGINVFLLALQPFNSNYWLSYKQATLQRIEREIEEAIDFAEKSPHPDPSEIMEDIYAPLN